jgi:hypothetical protein
VILQKRLLTAPVLDPLGAFWLCLGQRTAPFRPSTMTPSVRTQAVYASCMAALRNTRQLAELNRMGAGIFVALNQTDGKGRKRENIKRVRAVSADLDGAPLEPVMQCALKPHIVVETSPGRIPLYETEALDEWVRSKLSRPVGSTSELGGTGRE